MEEGVSTYAGILWPKEVRGKSFNYSEARQRRECLLCGKTQDEKLKDGEDD